jgi:glucose-1-phosphate thymidylyltransferase
MDGMKGLILAARQSDDELSLISGGRAPQVFPVANLPLLHHGIDALRAAGVEEIAIAVSPATVADVRDVAGEDFSYVETSAEPSLAEVLRAVTEFVGDDSVAVAAGDGLLLDPLPPLAEEFERTGADALLLVRQGGAEGVADLDSKRLLRVVDDQPPPPAGHLLAGVYFFGPKVLAAASEGARSVAQLMAALTDGGGRFETRPVRESWKYAGSSEDLLEANRLVLDMIEADTSEADLARARVTGRASIHPTAVLDRTTIRGPVAIGPGAVLVDTFVGPYTSIAENARLEGAEIEFSIVLGGATIRHPGKRIEASLVGAEASITRDFALPAALKLRVGKKAEISLA